MRSLVLLVLPPSRGVGGVAVCWLRGVLWVRGGWRGLREWGERKAAESQMTVAGANQCRYPTEFDLGGKTLFILKKKKVPWRKVSWFFVSHSFCLPLSLSKVCSLFLGSTSLCLVFNPLPLQEADCADLDAELLMCFTNVHGGDVHNRQARGLLWSIFDQRLAPLSCVFLCRGMRNTMAAK